MKVIKQNEIVLPPHIRYCIPGINEVRFISERQTLALHLGSCISTVFIGRSDRYILAANHIVIADSKKGSMVAPKNAGMQINEIIDFYNDYYGIPREDLYCLHLIGAGSRLDNDEFTVPERNIKETMRILDEEGITRLFCDTGSFMSGTYSLSGNSLSVMVENKHRKTHISFILDLDELYSFMKRAEKGMCASALKTENKGFERLVESKVITFITGEKKRL